MGKPKFSRIFDGKRYDLVGTHKYKSVAKIMADKRRKRNYNVRTMKEKNMRGKTVYRNYCRKKGR